ncbi:tegument serine/threonine protein kinase [Macropodid alphaherpesvirus 2]|uniref:Tegument serine/threonine protein kinase n=1 Tax=Macropodid alphaherpesvirus 2 TaxID=83440 RepID=A0AAE7SXV7_9ALPH|nr:tegument serine/threonine protein kinase [Macropodid alphaherpesvirus 2]QOD40211.1 tegument serine/threonine protein kinase [Macropodid alphaherpesvirus 2]WGO49750.1 tegument serine/threonine protein kinase [Macropodid alphaherpesvirus 2]
MDESRRSRPADNMANELGPGGTDKRSIRDWFLSHVRSFSKNPTRRGQSCSLHKTSEHQPHFRTRPRTGWFKWRTNRSASKIAQTHTQATRKRPPSIKRAPKRLVAPPLTPTHIFEFLDQTKTGRPIFRINPTLPYTSVQLPGDRSFGGVGGYGEVELIKDHKLAVKTIRDSNWYTMELITTLLVGQYTITALRPHNVYGFIIPLGFSVQRRQLLFPAYDMDFSKYITRLTAANPIPLAVAQRTHRCFLDLAYAVVFLNTVCGLSHLDIKGANILVRMQPDSLVLHHAVLADFSLVTLNSNSLVSRAQFRAPDPSSDNIQIFDVPPILSKVNLHTLVGHGYNHPPELLLKYINCDWGTEKKSPLRCELGLAVDLYALGQALLEMVVTTYVSPAIGVPVPRIPGYRYFDIGINPDYVIALMAYRCVLHQALFGSTLCNTPYGLSYDVEDTIANTIRPSKARHAFRAQCINYRRTHEALLADISLPLGTASLVSLVANLCHFNPEARYRYWGDGIHFSPPDSDFAYPTTDRTLNPQANKR